MEGRFPDFTFILQCWELNSGLAHAGKCSIAEFCFSCMILIVMVLFKNVLKIFLEIFYFIFMYLCGYLRGPEVLNQLQLDLKEAVSHGC